MNPQPPANQPPRPEAIPDLALSLESSFLGFFAHAGFLGALGEAGLRPRHIAGASSGAIIAVLAGAGFDTAEIRKVIFDPVFRRSFWEWGSFPRMMGMTLWLRGATGFTSARKAIRYLESVLRDRAPRLEDATHAKVSVAVANLTANRTEIRTEGEAARAIIASCAFPVLVCPQKLGEEWFWDGGLADSCPFAHYAADPEVRTIIAHHLDHPDHAERWHVPGFVPRISDAFGRAHALITRELREHHVAAVRSAGKQLFPVTTMVTRPGLFAGNKVFEKCYEEGWKSGEKFAAVHSTRNL